MVVQKPQHAATPRANPWLWRLADRGFKAFFTLKGWFQEGPLLSTPAHIVIIGGGTAGVTVAARLARRIDAPRLTLIESSRQHVYQPGQAFVGGGVLAKAQLLKSEADVLPPGGDLAGRDRRGGASGSPGGGS